MGMESMFLKGATEMALILLTLAILLALIRLVIGPDPADRIVALDLISVLIVAYLGAFSVYTGEKAFLDVAIAYALIAFLGTVALARFRERLAKRTGSGNSEEEG
ncbi:MAG TPA: monovalent cation/H+ antiporter complex subunit F [Desulfosalsimonadaceae bacterium]|nr:monovalent cation/H+ antiporter complex subunit F [Desulfosalsimonadaceae bacterium]